MPSVVANDVMNVVGTNASGSYSNVVVLKEKLLAKCDMFNVKRC